MPSIGYRRKSIHVYQSILLSLSSVLRLCDEWELSYEQRRFEAWCCGGEPIDLSQASCLRLDTEAGHGANLARYLIWDLTLLRMCTRCFASGATN